MSYFSSINYYPLPCLSQLQLRKTRLFVWLVLVWLNFILSPFFSPMNMWIHNPSFSCFHNWSYYLLLLLPPDNFFLKLIAFSLSCNPNRRTCFYSNTWKKKSDKFPDIQILFIVLHVTFWKVIFFVMPRFIDFCIMFVSLFQMLSCMWILGNLSFSLKKRKKISVKYNFFQGTIFSSPKYSGLAWWEKLFPLKVLDHLVILFLGLSLLFWYIL